MEISNSANAPRGYSLLSYSREYVYGVAVHAVDSGLQYITGRYYLCTNDIVLPMYNVIIILCIIAMTFFEFLRARELPCMTLSPP